MQIRAFITKLLIFSLPFIFFIVLYLVLDPFKVIRHYSSYYESGKPNYVSLNKDYISTENWMNYYPVFKYDSYIFGSSRSIYYEIDTWKNYINADARKCYHFDAFGESLYGISKKFSFLASQGAPIKNALIVLDPEILNQANNSSGHLYLKHPFVSGQNRIVFQVECLKSFFDFKFLRSYLDFKISGKVKDYMKKEFYITDRPAFLYDSITNEVRQQFYENQIHTDPAGFYGPRAGIFYERKSDQRFAKRVIKKEQKELLNTIKSILTEKGTSYKIVISPLYDQKKIDNRDLKELQTIFGAANVYDFSGINELTKTKYNYYETSHYRPHVAAAIMEKIYK